MAIEISNLDIIIRKVKERADKYKPVLAAATKVEEGRVKQRTQQGIGLNASFLGYSESWAKVRQENNKQTSFVDLTFTGDMFGSLNTKVTSVGENVTVATVAFNGALNNIKASANNKSRPFFGFTNEQVQIILNKLKLTK